MAGKRPWGGDLAGVEWDGGAGGLARAPSLLLMEGAGFHYNEEWGADRGLEVGGMTRFAFKRWFCHLCDQNCRGFEVREGVATGVQVRIGGLHYCGGGPGGGGHS